MQIKVIVVVVVVVVISSSFLHRYNLNIRLKDTLRFRICSSYTPHPLLSYINNKIHSPNVTRLFY